MSQVQMERTLKSGAVIRALEIPKDKFYKMLDAGKIPHTPVSPRVKLFNLDEVRGAIGGGKGRPVDDEDHHEFDEQDRDDEETVLECENAAAEAAQEAATSTFLDFIHKARKRKNRPLVKRLVASLANFQAAAEVSE